MLTLINLDFVYESILLSKNNIIWFLILKIWCSFYATFSLFFQGFVA